MSTICGHFVRNGKTESKDVYDMLRKMEHRGPDTHGAYLDGRIVKVDEIDEMKEELSNETHIALGHSRLKLMDGEKMTQPYISCDDKLALIHNGDIYNYQKLRTLLYKHHEIKTNSDSEIIIHLLEEVYQGDLLTAIKKIIGLLDGTYSLAVTDGETVVVARDPIGKTPLYYIINDNITYFASEKKALWNGKDTPKRLNPGDILSINNSGLEMSEGFHLQFPQIDIVEFREAVEIYKDALIKAVKKRLMGLSISRIGVIFSGGIDSVFISKLLQREGKNIICYCTGTEESGDIMAAYSVAEELGLELKTTIITEDMVEQILPEIIQNVEEGGLLQVEVAIPMYLAAKLAAEDNIKVMFTGQAADELFAGYPWYKNVLSDFGYLGLHERLWEDLILSSTDTLEREDKLTMAHSIELRAPYLDKYLIQTAMRMSPRLKIQDKNDDLRKTVHRQAAVELGIPPHIAFRSKSPAQSGSGIHEIIAKIAKKYISDIDPDLVNENISRDKGSIYRYGQKMYGDDAARIYVQRIEEDIQKRYIPPFLVD